MKNFLTKSSLLILLFLCYNINNVSAQADAGKDKVIAKGKSGTVIGGKGDPSWCYSWTPATGLSDSHILNPTANPDKTTTYTLKIIGPNFQYTAEDDMKVFVIEDLKLEVENNLTECMEGRTLTYTAKAIGDLSGTLPEQFEFTFHYKKANGTEWTETDWSLDNEEDNMVVADNVLNGDTDHKFTTPIYVEAKIGDCKLKSNTINIDVFELWIEYVQHDVSHPWKVVVGDNINYSATASTDCKNWDWDMEDGFSDVWNPSGGNQKAGTMVIPTADLPAGSDWHYFGDKYGTVNVKCEDEEGNIHQFYSTEISPATKVKVFFPLHYKLPSGNPAWYDYWSYATGTVDLHKYNGSLATSEMSMDASGSWTIRIGQNAHWSIAGNFPTGSKFINGFWASVLHEVRHRDHMLHNIQVHGGFNPTVDFDFDLDGICNREPTDTIGFLNGGWEALCGLNPTIPNSLEDVANHAEATGVFNHQHKDWSYTGPQW